jgi:hypothetical protein
MISAAVESEWRRTSKPTMPTLSLPPPTRTKRSWSPALANPSAPMKAPSVIATTRSGVPCLRKPWAKRIASFTLPGASVACRPRASSRSRRASDVKGMSRRGCAPAPITIIFCLAPRPSINASHSRRAISNRATPCSCAFMLALRSMTTTRSPAAAPKKRSHGSASAAISSAAASSCRISSRFFRRSQPSRVPSGRSFRTRSQIKKVAVRSCKPRGLRLCKNRISGTAPASKNSAAGKRQIIGQATLLTWRSVWSTNSSKGTAVDVRR